MLGSPTSSVTVEEFADFQCPTCGAMHPVLKEVQTSYGSKIKFIFRNFPLPMHDKSYDAAVAAEAAGMQGKFWQMQDQLFSNQKAWSTQTPNNQIWLDYAEKIGLDIEKFKTDVAGIAAKSRVDQDVARAKALNVGSTPTVFVNGQMVPLEDFNAAGFRRIIDAELQKTQTPVASTSAPVGGTSNANSNSK
jgi:protein-disulfide isomerase